MKIKESLRISEAIYRRIVETADEGIWIVDPLGKTLFVNSKMADMLGYTWKELIEQNGLEFMEAGKTPETEDDCPGKYPHPERI